jgi:cyanophycinase
MAKPDRRASELAGGFDASVRIIPAAAAPDNNHRRAGRNGVNWFKKLGAVNVAALSLIDRKSADDPVVVKSLQRSKMVYMLGGFPRHLAQSLDGSDSWQAILAAHRSGAVIAGSSAGAMILCDHYYDPYEKNILNGLGLIADACILPHHDTFGKNWAAELAQRLAGVILIGIDEQTGMLNDGPNGRWQVYGDRSVGVTLYKNDRQTHIAPGTHFDLKF